jgi:uncharacterized protein YycO
VWYTETESILLQGVSSVAVRRKTKVAFGALLILVLLRLFPPFVEKSAHVVPDYPQVDLTEILQKDALEPGDYQAIYEQTGLGKAAVDALMQEEDGIERLLFFQEKLFEEVEFVCEPNSIISNEERLVEGGTEFAHLQNGYVLITKASHTLSWRNGHAAIVVDAERGQTLESVVLGTNSCLQDISKWLQYPNFMVLKLKGADRELLGEIAAFAKTYLNDVPYSLTLGILKKKYEPKEEISGTHCAHLIWRAFREYGFDLDSTGGRVVTPKDLAGSPLFEVVQVYGMDPKNPWP